MIGEIVSEIDYRNVLSEQVIRHVERLLRITETEARSTSLVLSKSIDPFSGLMSLRGLGMEIWGDEDAQAYVNRLRQEWRR
jgi:hypothetical protein